MVKFEAIAHLKLLFPLFLVSYIIIIIIIFVEFSKRILGE